MTEYNFKTLMFLRKHAKLGLKDWLALDNYRDETIGMLKKFYNAEHADIGFDDTPVLKKEFELRYKALELKLCGDYLDSKSNIGVEAFTDNYIQNGMEKEEEIARKREAIRSLRLH